MTISAFLKLVELPTKVASIIPFLFGSLYAFYTFEEFHFIHAIIMFLSMLIFDMTTTAINNYIDYSKAHQRKGYGYEVHNAMVSHGLKPGLVRSLIYAMLILSTALGLYLVYDTNIVVLALGMICFAIGILYTFGPLPISRTPFGELFSGLTMGLILPFITIYIQVFDQGVLNFSYDGWQLHLLLNIKVLIGILIVCLPFTYCIANIMLANNLCDMEEDIVNKRYTLPIYIGRKAGLTLWASLYYFSYIAIIIGVLLSYLPWFSLLTVITLIPVQKNIAQFKALQTKKDTFILAIKNFLLLSSAYIITLILGIIF